MPNTAIDFFLLSENEVKLESFYLDSSSKSTICQIISNQKDFNFSPSEVELLYSLSIKYINKSITKKEIKNTILNIRGGDIWGFLDGLITISMIVILIKNDGVLSFGTNKNLIDIHHNRKYNYPSESPSSLKVERPSLVPHAQFISLSQEEKRALYHKYDKNMTHDGYPKLTIGFYQAKYKVRDHGAIHDIDYTIKNNGGTKSLRTDENALKLMY